MVKHKWIACAALAALGIGGANVARAAIIINEIDSDSANTPSTDHAEFIELYSTTGGVESLTGLSVVLFNGNGDVSYAALDLDGQSTDGNGYYLIGSNSIANAQNYSLLGAGNILQNGADAVALYTGDATSFPNGTVPTTTNLLDAIVYDTADVDDTALLTALGETVQYDEFGGVDAAFGAANAIGRLPNGSGDFTNTAPTPGSANVAVPEPASLGLMAAGALLLGGRRRS
jgi:hypothetical protein